MARKRPWPSFTTTHTINSGFMWPSASPEVTLQRGPFHLTYAEGKTPYPRLYLFSLTKVDPTLLRVSQNGVQFALSVTRTEPLGQVKKIPDGWESIMASDDLMSEFMKAVVIRTFETEIRLLQDLVVDLALDGSINPERTAKDFDRVTKLVALAGSNQPNEARLARTRAVECARRMITNARTSKD